MVLGKLVFVTGAALVLALKLEVQPSGDGESRILKNDPTTEFDIRTKGYKKKGAFQALTGSFITREAAE